MKYHSVDIKRNNRLDVFSETKCYEKHGTNLSKSFASFIFINNFAKPLMQNLKIFCMQSKI
ncbi:MAG: hypothetical protein A2928_03370 [Candidatus Taylorbacteria bacterium RIFCSPLOWO2_01_FULL_45_15b]|uniref:Uncharacterized protein n=1 Tax=Candidatus Taylorbacteria bacterium RIFCSPLOWO2_01_FULL_45_15b TaxID=1802319 RepID=A0A1G2NHQ0_9BACT|nr:MAG: hypothetical protein A2928_03370 [Candidatus Taylorbacteria bacterium RIFCSPLOWO2_01_FULL_45_15b]